MNKYEVENLIGTEIIEADSFELSEYGTKFFISNELIASRRSKNVTKFNN